MGALPCRGEIDLGSIATKGRDNAVVNTSACKPGSFSAVSRGVLISIAHRAEVELHLSDFRSNAIHGGSSHPHEIEFGRTR